MTKIFRIQDADGRGPFKPGLSARWIDFNPKVHEATLRAWPEEFPELFFSIRILRMIYCGCGCVSEDQLRLWFSRAEVERMSRLGLKPITMEVDEVLAESNVQVVFRRLKPLRMDVQPIELY